MIADTHVHVWDIEQLRYDWLAGNQTVLNRTYTLDMLEAERVSVGITHGVLVQAANTLEETDFLLCVADQTEWIKAVVGWLPLLQPEAVNRLIRAEVYSNNWFKGVRHLVHDEPDPDWILQPQVVESLKILSEYNIPFDFVGINNRHLKNAFKLSKLVPRLRIVLDHLNQPPPFNSKEYKEWEQLIIGISENTNIYSKISGLGTASGLGAEWTADSMEVPVSIVIEAFGTDRCFCGGDWPVSLLAGNYPETWDKYKVLINRLCDSESAGKILFHNAVNFYSL